MDTELKKKDKSLNQKEEPLDKNIKNIEADTKKEETCSCDLKKECDKECSKDLKKDKKIFKKENKLEQEITSLKQKNEELTNKLLYSQAEFANFKKRRELETSNMLKYANLDIVKEILPIVDNFERAIKLDDSNLNDELSKFLDGFKMIYSHLVELLKKFEVTEIDCLNKEFDPNIAQALMTIKVEGVKPGMVVEVLQKGYMLKDKMIRPALVKVSEEN